MSKVRHIKTSKTYKTLGQVINTTNAQDNKRMKAYVKEEDLEKLKKFTPEEVLSYVNTGSIDELFADIEIYVRDTDEFETKIENIG